MPEPTADPSPEPEPASAPVAGGVHLERTEENVREIAALAQLVGGACSIDGVLDDLKYQARPSRLGRWLGRAVHRAWTWDRFDRRDRRWWPQGVTTSADASDEEEIRGRRVLCTTWYSKEIDGSGHGSRVTFLDLDSLRYRHVLLVVPVLADDGVLRLEPLRIHAGGIVWAGPYLHIAATTRGFVTCRLDDLMRVPGDDDRPGEIGVFEGRVASFGHRYVLPVRFRYQAYADEGHRKLRYSFLSLDRRSTPPALLAGEYGTDGATSRLARFPIDAATGLLATDERGWSRPISLDVGGLVHMQGAVIARGRYHVSVSRTGFLPGSMYVGTPGHFRHRPLATPPGPEDVAWWPSTDLLWSVTEHPWRRWIFCMERSWFD